MKMNSVKKFAARFFDVSGINYLGYVSQKMFKFPFIRVINYHDITKNQADNFEKQLQFYSNRFVNVTEKDLREFLTNGNWKHKKPGLILSFDDGLRSHYEIAAPLLEKYGFTGWFFVPVGAISDLPEPVFLEKTIEDIKENYLNSEQLEYLDKNHIVGCHTETHRRLGKENSDEIMKRETLGAKQKFEKMLGHNVEIFCWVGGEENSYSKNAADFIKQGYHLSFMTNNEIVTPKTNPLQIQRTNIEADNPLWLVRFQVSGLMDLAYAPKRNRVNKLTA